ncbi:serine hydrolase domain-containing protein [Agromyces laixinhei]|uniref:serine hydrolase domain-containing protein n=1 Tax=Agromyces laixinhei TaxID=2585717 RepID=UPI0012ED1AC4|nr:serine hydrolase domain-containing protein [Agromyces laixinhei]
MTAGDAEGWRSELDRLRQRHDVPGAQLGIVRLGRGGDEHDRTLVESGVLDIATGDPVRRDSSFQIGSITKAWTAAAALRLDELGILSVAAPVRAVLPSLALADPAVAEEVTLADLLAHRSGIVGDRFRETGDDDLAIARYVDDLGDAEQVHPLRERFSYGNAGYVIAGRAIEVAAGMPWRQVVHELIDRPLGFERVAAPTRAEDVEAPAIGHVFRADGRLTRAEPWSIPPGMAPAGILTTDASSVLDLLAMTMRGGTTGDGQRVLSPETVAAMCSPAIRTAVPGIDAWGLGWMIERWDDAKVFGHDGGTNGQFAFARAVPSAGCAFVLLTNGGRARPFFDELMPMLAREVAGLNGPVAPAPADGAPANGTSGLFPSGAAGRYRNGDSDLVIDVDGRRAAAELLEAGENPATGSAVIPAASGAGFVWQRDGESFWRTLVPDAAGLGVQFGLRFMRRA